ncbi:MAG: hypothetical protein Q9227_002197 [Pyrenula ochraceoflavens]
MPDDGIEKSKNKDAADRKESEEIRAPFPPEPLQEIASVEGDDAEGSWIFIEGQQNGYSKEPDTDSIEPVHSTSLTNNEIETCYVEGTCSISTSLHADASQRSSSLSRPASPDPVDSLYIGAQFRAVGDNKPTNASNFGYLAIKEPVDFFDIAWKQRTVQFAVSA